MRLIVAFLALTALCVPAGAASIACSVADPTGTPLNIRTEPNGIIVTRARNGEPVLVFDGEEKYDRQGRKWYFVALRGSSAPDGYAIAAYIRC